MNNTTSYKDVITYYLVYCFCFLSFAAIPVVIATEIKFVERTELKLVTK